MAGFAINRSRQSAAEQTPAFGGIAERFRRAGDLDRAVALCREGLQRFPDLLSARVTLGWALLDQGKYDEAQEALEQVLKRAPDNLAAIRGLAELHQRAESAMPNLDGSAAWHTQEQTAGPIAPLNVRTPEDSERSSAIRVEKVSPAAASRQTRKETRRQPAKAKQRFEVILDPIMEPVADVEAERPAAALAQTAPVVDRPADAPVALVEVEPDRPAILNAQGAEIPFDAPASHTPEFVMPVAEADPSRDAADIMMFASARADETEPVVELSAVDSVDLSAQFAGVESVSSEGRPDIVFADPVQGLNDPIVEIAAGESIDLGDALDVESFERDEPLAAPPVELTVAETPEVSLAAAIAELEIEGEIVVEEPVAVLESRVEASTLVEATVAPPAAEFEREPEPEPVVALTAVPDVAPLIEGEKEPEFDEAVPASVDEPESFPELEEVAAFAALPEPEPASVSAFASTLELLQPGEMRQHAEASVWSPPPFAGDGLELLPLVAAARRSRTNVSLPGLEKLLRQVRARRLELQAESVA